MNQAAPASSISDIRLSGAANAALSGEQQRALEDLKRSSHFHPQNDNHGPYDIALSVVESRLVMEIRNAVGQDLNMLVLSLSPYRRLIHDYFMMIDSFEQARRGNISPCKMEAIDMGRRALHNEGADLLISRLQGKIDMDFETARRFFTLVCVLYKPG